MQRCTKCSVPKDVNDFYSYDKRCKQCIKEYTRSRHANRTQQQKDEYNYRRREALKQQRAARTPEEKIKLSIQASEKRIQRKQRMSDERLEQYREMKRRHAADRKARLSDLEILETKQRRNLRTKKRYQEDANFRLSCVLRARFNAAIKDGHKAGSAVKDLGCSIPELKKHLESQFQLGMTWDNWSQDGWHIDHIRPLASFDLTNPKELKKACHYSNLQPLWAEDNLKKIASDLNQIRTTHVR